MIARIAYFEGVDFNGRDYILEAANKVPGFNAGYHLYDPASGQGVSVTIWDTAEALDDGTDAIRQSHEEAGRPPAKPARVDTYDVVRSA